MYGRPDPVNYPKVDVLTVFEKIQPLYLEIGAGKGGFICEMAKLYPNRNFIAVEKDENVIVSGVERAKAEGLMNVRFIACRAENLPFLFPLPVFDGLFLNFSCPYPKGTYKNRRLTNPRFLKVYQIFLNENAPIIQKTDNRPFFEYSVESFLTCGYRLEEMTFDLYSSDYVEENVPTEYEKKFVSENKPICRLKAVFEKTP